MYIYLSIDGGQNFVTTNVFTNLAVGPYNVVIQDDAGICLYEEGVPIDFLSKLYYCGKTGWMRQDRCFGYMSLLIHEGDRWTRARRKNLS